MSHHNRVHVADFASRVQFKDVETHTDYRQTLHYTPIARYLAPMSRAASSKSTLLHIYVPCARMVHNVQFWLFYVRVNCPFARWRCNED